MITMERSKTSLQSLWKRPASRSEIFPISMPWASKHLDFILLLPLYYKGEGKTNRFRTASLSQS